MNTSYIDISQSDIPAKELASLLAGSDLLRSTIHIATKRAVSIADSTLISLTLPFENIDPLAVLEAMGQKQEFRYYWEHPAEELSIAAGKIQVRIKANQRNRFMHLSSQMNSWKNRTFSHCLFTHSLAGIHFLGGFSFLDQPQTFHWKSFGSASMVIPEWMMIRDGKLNLLTINQKISNQDDPAQVEQHIYEILESLINAVRSLDNPEPKLSATDSNQHHINGQLQDPVARKRWNENVSRAKNLIHDKHFEKIVIAREVTISVEHQPDVTRMVNELRNNYPTCYTFLFQPDGDHIFIGSTPERLASFRSTYLLTEGLAGTISRGKTASEDTILEKKLLGDTKERNEHSYVVRAISERLGHYTTDIEYPDTPSIRKYQNVQHLYTPITASINSNIPILSLLDALHPTPAVGGFPLGATSDYISSLEQFDRGWYAGSVGWINLNGRGEFNVAIRSGLVEPGKIRLYAGCGILEDSNIDQEWDETTLKFIPMVSALERA